MQNYPRRMVIFGFVTSAIVGLATIVDLAIDWPYAGRIFFDLTFLLCSIFVGYMSYDTWYDVIERLERPRRRKSPNPVVRQQNRHIRRSTKRQRPHRSARTSETAPA